MKPVRAIPALAAAAILILAAFADSEEPAKLTYHQFIHQVRTCNGNVEHSQPPQDPAAWRKRFDKWRGCMGIVMDQMPAEQRTTLQRKIAECNGKFPYESMPGDNIHCMRGAIRASFPDAPDPSSRYRMIGAEIAGKCMQSHPDSNAAQLACIREGLKQLKSAKPAPESASGPESPSKAK